MIVDAAAGGALMNKNYTATYALIEDMAQNHYKWTNERAINSFSPFRKIEDRCIDGEEEDDMVLAEHDVKKSMYEISSLDHLATKVDVLTLKFDKMNTSAVSPAPVSPPCEVCGVFSHIEVDCQLGSSIEDVEQTNYAQYNQRMRQNQNFYKNSSEFLWTNNTT
ncbi:hypothetical protein MTR_6g049110 [Medicago truncatula]|uniref:Uncharacterized protein n=1 Tax=Medicago truncatula TaxID=3880 RepID=A0A072UKB6_MEDTR|nr:hypothetical protein MTR_6g049110 [Medicago truncatula]